MKKSSLVYEISWKLAIIVLLEMGLSAYVSIKKVSANARETFIEAQKDIIQRLNQQKNEVNCRRKR